MSFVEQDDVLNTIEPVLYNVFDEFSDYNKEQKWNVSKYPFKRIPYKDALNIYGTDKPDLRNPIEIFDVTDIFKRDDVKFEIFKKLNTFLLSKKIKPLCKLSDRIAYQLLASEGKSIFDVM